MNRIINTAQRMPPGFEAMVEETDGIRAERCAGGCGYYVAVDKRFPAGSAVYCEVCSVKMLKQADSRNPS